MYPAQTLQAAEIQQRETLSPSFRHAAPSAPWPWVDIDDGINNEQLRLMDGRAPPISELCDHKECDNCWRGYPGSRFPNWTSSQVKKSKIMDHACKGVPEKPCVLHYLDVDPNGSLKNSDKTITEVNAQEGTWKAILDINRPTWSRTRAIFLENLSGSVLQMLGTKYNIEPFFFSSSLNWIPSRFQEDMQPGIGDHITVVLTFLRSVSTERMPDREVGTRLCSGDIVPSRRETIGAAKSSSFGTTFQAKAPLELQYTKQYLCLDLLSVHLIRNINGSTLISYHPSLELPTTEAEDLHDRIRFAGQSVYWQKMFQQSSDPTLLLLNFLWYGIYSWDQALEHLYNHICQLESSVVDTSRWKLTQELHIIRAHELYYVSLLDDFKKSIEFIRRTENPAMSSPRIDGRDKMLSKQFLDRECDRMILEIDRLESDLAVQEKRLKNVTDFVFSTVNISDSKLMAGMTEVTLRDSTVVRQISYLSMVFLPASFITTLFGMNITEFQFGTGGTLTYYVACAIPLTMFTVWIIVAFQSRYLMPNAPLLKRLGWPWFLLKDFMNRKDNRKKQSQRVVDRTIMDDCHEDLDLRSINGIV